MAAMIEYVCTAQHKRRDDPSVTLEQGSWAYCSYGAVADHQWTKIDPTAVEALRSVRGNARPRLAMDGATVPTGRNRPSG